MASTRMSFLVACLLLWAAVPTARGKKLDAVLKRLEALEAKVEAQDLGRVQEQLNELRSQMGSLQEELLRKANAHEVMSPAEIHERFRMFHQAQASAATTTAPATAVRSEAPHADVMSRAEVHDPFRLFAQSLGSARSAPRCTSCASSAPDVELQEASAATLPAATLPAAGRSEAPHMDVMSRAEVHDRFRLFAQSLQGSAARCTNCTSSTTDVELQEVALPAERSWMGWFFSVGMMCGGVLLGLFSLCVALGESKALEDRLLLLEERFEDRKFINLATSTAEPSCANGLPLRGKLLSGAAGAAVGSTTGAVSGSLAGGAFGAVAGLVPAVFTFGLSIPLGAAMGSSLGLMAGSLVGGGTGAIGAVKAATWYKARKDKC